MNRNIGIDIIRGISALLIVSYHYTCHYNLSPYTAVGHTEWGFVVPWGCWAVVTFFMISGYLSSGKVKDDAKPINLLKRRFLRLYPTFWAAMLVTFIITSIAKYDSYTIKDILLNVTMLPSLFGAKPIDGVYWTQQYEVLFYLILVGLISIRRSKYINWALLLWTLFSVVLYLIQIKIDNPLVSSLRVFAIPQYCSAFIAGMLIRNFTGRKDIVLSVVVLIISVVNFWLWHDTGQTTFFVITLLVLAAIIICPPHIPQKWEHLLRPILFVSSISYPLYLVHQKIGYTMILNMVTGLHWHSEWMLLIPFCVVLLLAWMLHKFVEVKF